MDTSPQQDLSNKHYLSNMSTSLTIREKVVVLLIDEIYITSRLDYRSKNIIGVASNTNELAKTILAFMICSAFGNFSEIVKLLPVHNITGDEMKPITLSVIEFIQNCGFEVLCIITDNHRINRNLFKKLSSNGIQFPNPQYSDKKFFLSYDFVHVFKNIRNNWVNLKNFDKAFVFPDFVNNDNIKMARFKDLRDAYDSEKHLVVKKAYILNYKAMYPTNLEKQKVYLVDNIFHHSTIAAMRDFKYNETADFLEIIRNWWDIVNNTSTFKGCVKLNQFARPVTSDSNDFRVSYLQNFLLWVDKWESLVTNGHLTKDTFAALRQSTLVFLELVKYSFQNFEISYILPGKFTTERLEKRFGKYRSLCGCNYNVSFDDVINAEKKIRLKHVFRGAGNTFSLKEIQSKFENSCTTETCNFNDFTTVDIDKFIDILNTPYLNESHIDQGIKIYICGYASHSIAKKLNCEFCKSFLVEDKGSCIENEYFDNLQRGGLSIPTNYVEIIFFHMFSIFDSIINNSSLEVEFLRSTNQKCILCKLTLQSIKSDFVYVEFLQNCLCGRDYTSMLYKLLSIFANVLLNDYVKQCNNTRIDNVASKKKTTDQHSSQQKEKIKYVPISTCLLTI